MALENHRHLGVVSMFHDTKGYGFIKPDDGTADIFVHHSAIQSETRSDGSRGFAKLWKGQQVEFNVVLDEGGQTKAAAVSGPGGAAIGRGGGGGGGARIRGGSDGGFGRGNDGKCFNCGDFGHKAAECQNSPSNGGCYTCGGPHKARDCPNGVVTNGGGSNVECYNCGNVGHIAKECNNAGRRKNSNAKQCYTCGESDHLAKDCGAGGSFVGGGATTGTCYTCSGVGHLARDCPTGRSSGGGRGGGNFSRGGGGKGCYNCGDLGHFARDCNKAAPEE